MSKFDIRFYLQNAIKYSITKKLILTDKFELDIIELLKIKGRENDEKELNQLNSWIERVTGTDYKNFTRCNFGSRQKHNHSKYSNYNKSKLEIYIYKLYKSNLYSFLH